MGTGWGLLVGVPTDNANRPVKCEGFVALVRTGGRGGGDAGGWPDDAGGDEAWDEELSDPYGVAHAAMPGEGDA